VGQAFQTFLKGTSVVTALFARLDDVVLHDSLLFGWRQRRNRCLDFGYRVVSAKLVVVLR